MTVFLLTVTVCFTLYACTHPCVHISESCVSEVFFTDSDSVLHVANSCIHDDIHCSNSLSTSTDTDSSDILNDVYVTDQNLSKLLYICLCQLNMLNISALLHSGSTINIMIYSPSLRSSECKFIKCLLNKYLRMYETGMQLSSTFTDIKEKR